MILDRISEVFGGTDMVMETTLKNPNQFREAVIFEHLKNLPTKKIAEFANSVEARTMINEGIISYETLKRLTHDHDDNTIQTTVCHMAKENGDPIWDEFVRLRIEERRLMNELLEKYGDEAKSIAEDVDKNFVEGFIPEYFRTI